MPFSIAEADSVGAIMSGTISTLTPGPSLVEYPERFTNDVRYSKDGNPIIQAPLKDGRPRSWIWKRYRNTVPKYSTLYNQLLNYQYHLRQLATPPKSPWVYVRDTETNNLSFRQWNGTTWTEINTWVRVKVIMVTQQVGEGGGPAVYDTTTFTFVIDDPAWNGF